MKCVLISVNLVPISQNLLIREGRKHGLNLIIKIYNVRKFRFTEFQNWKVLYKIIIQHSRFYPVCHQGSIGASRAFYRQGKRVHIQDSLPLLQGYENKLVFIRFICWGFILDFILKDESTSEESLQTLNLVQIPRFTDEKTMPLNLTLYSSKTRTTPFQG